MKKGLFLILFAALLPMRALGADAAPETSAQAMVLIHPASGTILAEKNASDPHLIASTTKLMTALVAAQTLPMDKSVEIRSEWTLVEGSSMYLRPGESYSVRELLEGLLLASGNDAALALAETVSGDVESFVARMNEEAQKMELRNTHFENPHGLDGERHYSCAADLARIMAEALKIEPLRQIMGESRCTIHGAIYENHNKLLRSCQGVFAGKTGYTMAAGRCLASACERDGMELICVTLSDPDDWRDHAALYDWAFANYKDYSVRAGESVADLPTISGRTEMAALTVAKDVSVCAPKDASLYTKSEIPPFAFAPLRSGESVGTLTVYVNDRAAVTVPLVWAENVQRSGGAALLIRDVADRLMGIYRI